MHLIFLLKNYPNRKLVANILEVDFTQELLEMRNELVNKYYFYDVNIKYMTSEFIKKFFDQHLNWYNISGNAELVFGLYPDKIEKLVFNINLYDSRNILVNLIEILLNISKIEF